MRILVHLIPNRAPHEGYLAAIPPIYIKISMYGQLAHSALSVGEPLLIIFNITTAPRLVPSIQAMT